MKAVQAALLNQRKRGKKEEIVKLCTSLESSARLRTFFVNGLIENFYLTRAIRSLGDTEDKAIEAIVKELPKLPLPYKLLVDCLSGRGDFGAPGLKLSPESPAGAVQKAALILHVSSLLTAEFTKSKNVTCPFLSFIHKPENCKDSFVPGIPDTPVTDSKDCFHFCNQEVLKGVSVFQCTCAVRYATKSPECVCPRCKSKCAPVQNTEKSLTQAAVKGYVPVAVSQIGNDSFRVRNMTPISFRVLHIFVHSALYGGVALKLVNDSQLAQLLALQRTDGDPAQECFLLIVKDLEVLCRLLSWSEEEVINWLHLVLEETSSHLVQCRQSTVCLTNQSREQWETTFTEKVEAMLRDPGDRLVLSCAHNS